MNPLLSWVIPPVVGAFIGYVTNVVAVKMLFRPLREIRLGGRFRLPFTPGILPRERHRLADNIGRMVERELLTAEVVSARLKQPEVWEGIRQSVAFFTEKLLAASPADMVAFLPRSSPPDFLKSLISDLAKSPGFDLVIESLGESLSAYARRRGVLEKSLREIAGETVMVKLGERVGEKLVSLVESRGAAGLGEYMFHAAEGFYPEAAALFIRFLGREEIRRELEVQGQVFLSRVMTKLNVFQRFFLSAGQYDKTLQDRMPEIIDDLIDQAGGLLARENIRFRFLEFLKETVRHLSEARENRERLYRLIAEWSASLADRPLGDFISEEDLEKWGSLVRRLPGIFSPPPEGGGGGGDRFLFAGIFCEKILEKLRIRGEAGGKSLGWFLALEGEKKDALDVFITGKICALADRQTAAALRSINVRVLVADRIDALDMIQVEQIVLDVMANQLKWINVFGGILGALIGVSQSILAWLTR